MNEPPTVLVADDEPAVRRLYAQILADYDVRMADSGQAALAEFDETVDVVLLDRRMPTMTGDAVLSQLRDRGVDCPVAMLTAVDPEPGIVDLPFDDYLTKPVTADELVDFVDALLERASVAEASRDLFASASKLAALEAEYTHAELRDMAEYRALTDRVATLKGRSEALVSEVSSDRFEQLLGDIDRGSRHD